MSAKPNKNGDKEFENFQFQAPSQATSRHPSAGPFQGDLVLDAGVILSTFWSRVGIIGELWGNPFSTSLLQRHFTTNPVAG